MPFRPVIGLPLLEARDEPWLGKVLDVVEASIGQSWHVLLARLAHAPTGASPAEAAAIAGTLRRAAGARTKNRPVALPGGRPAGRTLAARVNLECIQRAVRRSHQVQLQIWEGADALVRAAARLGLPAQVTHTASLATVLDIAGPLSIYRGAAAYERALAALVPLLAEHARFRLEIRTRVGRGASARERVICVEPPVLLPSIPPQRPRPPWRVERLAADLTEAGCAVKHAPAPIPSGDHLLFPDLELALPPRAPDAGRDVAGRPRVWIELVGFATDELLARKLARYEAAAVAAAAAPAAAPAPAAPASLAATASSLPPRRFVLCVDATRGPRVLAGPHGPLGAILPFRRRVLPAALLALLAPP